jgi:transposase
MKTKRPEIRETVEELKHSLTHEHDGRKKQRLHALYLLKSGRAATRLDVASLLGVHRHSVGTWLARYARGGLPALLQRGKPPGKRPQLGQGGLSQLQERLSQPSGFASYKEIHAYLAREQGAQLSYARVHAIVRYQLQAKLKAPRKSHREKSPSRSTPL